MTIAERILLLSVAAPEEEVLLYYEELGLLVEQVKSMGVDDRRRVISMRKWVVMPQMIWLPTSNRDFDAMYRRN